MVVDYNKKMKLLLYKNGEIEIYEGPLIERKWYICFRNVDELIALLKSDKKLLPIIKKRLRGK